MAADAFKRAENELGKMDIVVNNAGISDESQWRKMIEINLVNPLCLSKLYLWKEYFIPCCIPTRTGNPRVGTCPLPSGSPAIKV